jgi:hypothetical protein
MTDIVPLFLVERLLLFVVDTKVDFVDNFKPEFKLVNFEFKVDIELNLLDFVLP